MWLQNENTLEQQYAMATGNNNTTNGRNCNGKKERPKSRIEFNLNDENQVRIEKIMRST